jgi:hypothetical protein
MTDLRQHLDGSPRADVPMEILVAYDATRWISLPPSWPHHGHDDARSWVAATVRDVCTRSLGTTRANKRWLTRTLQRLAEWRDENELKYLYLPSVTSEFLLLRIQYGHSDGDGDRDATLRQLALTTDLDALEPPLPQEVVAAGLGRGLRGIVHAEVAGRLTAMVATAFRSEPYDVRVACELGAPDDVPLLLPVVDDFIDGISVVRAE